MIVPKGPQEPAPNHRALHVLLAGAVSVACVGFLVGTRSTTPPLAPRVPASAPLVPVRPAPTYTELASAPLGRNTHWRQSVSQLRAEPELTAPVPTPAQEREDALAARATRRAYDGAPPTIPHPVEQRGVLACLECHGQGAVVQGRRAPAISHAELTNCTQCHVVSDNTQAFAPPPPDSVATHNSFRPVPPRTFGERAYEGAPPTVPHPVAMRSQCLSCHGPGGAEGLKSSHPWRQSCLQCHAPGASLDHRPVLDLAPVGGLK